MKHKLLIAFLMIVLVKTNVQAYKRLIRNVILITFILSSSLLYGQSYKPIVIDGNSWNLLYHIYPSSFKCGKSISSDNYLRTEILKLSKDTLVRDTLYKILLTSFDSLSLNWSIAGFLREDIDNKKVYYRPAKFPNDIREQEEYLLYDFDLKLKDTMRYEDGYFNIVVDTIDTLIYNTIKYKRIKFYDNTEWLESVGDLNGLLSSTMSMPCGSPKPKLLCFNSKDLLAYKMKSTEFDKCFYWEDYSKSSLDFRKGESFEITPNPAKEFVTINSYNENRSLIAIYDIQGQLLKTSSLKDNVTKIDINDLPNGLYFIRISNATSIYNNKFFVKH